MIKSYDVPLLDKLYEIGFDTPDKYVNLNIEEIENIKGFGSHRIEQLNQAIMKMDKINDRLLIGRYFFTNHHNFIIIQISRKKDIHLATIFNFMFFTDFFYF